MTESPSNLNLTTMALYCDLPCSSMLNDLRAPPGNRLEALLGARKGQFSIRVNDQWRICFVWRDNQAWDVEIVDYH
jgi:toxin HigB-1